MPYEKIARLTTTTRSIVDDQLPRKAANLFRLGFPPTASKLPIVTPMRATSKDRFRELKDLMRHHKVRETGGVKVDETFSVASSPTFSSNGTGKKRPGYYESMMTRPRHFSQGHYMNMMKPNSEDIDNSLTVTAATPHVINFVILILYRLTPKDHWVPINLCMIIII